LLPAKVVQLVLEWRRLNRRMHNKSFIVDGTTAVIGGRNIGDAYFDAADSSNFRDLDVIAIGPVVTEASRTFDDYWNSDAAVPVAAFGKKRDPQRDLNRERDALARDARSRTMPRLRSRSFRAALPRTAPAAGSGVRPCWSPISPRKSRPRRTNPRCASVRNSSKSSTAHSTKYC
jgi:phosphatidylserine/phosphatidylglycerophosphate/cardiolipin synthase-like enzyme